MDIFQEVCANRHYQFKIKLDVHGLLRILLNQAIVTPAVGLPFLTKVGAQPGLFHMSASSEAIRREIEVSTVIPFEVFSTRAVVGSLGEDDGLVGIVECYKYDDGDVINMR